MPPIISIENLTKSYASGVEALKPVTLAIEKGEIFALLGPNGAGKTTLINIICGIVTASGGRVTAGGHDVVRDYRAARAKIGLVPQELTTTSYETVWATVNFTRGLFGRAPDPHYVTRLLRDLSLSEKRDSKVMTLSGGMKRRVMIAKALSHEPEILFLDEPTAGVDVELRRDMWNLVRELRDTRRDGDIDHALHRGGRGDGRPDRRDEQGRPHSRGRQGCSDEKLRQEAADPAAGAADDAHSAGTRGLGPEARGRAPAGIDHGRRGRGDSRAAGAHERAGHRHQGPADPPELAGGHLREIS